MSTNSTIPDAETLDLAGLITPTENGIASRVLAKTDGGSLSLFAFDVHQELSEHTSPFDAMVLTLEGQLELTIGGKPVQATPGTIVRIPANVPHSVLAKRPSKMLLVMLRKPN